MWHLLEIMRRVKQRMQLKKCFQSRNSLGNGFVISLRYVIHVCDIYIYIFFDAWNVYKYNELHMIINLTHFCFLLKYYLYMLSKLQKKERLCSWVRNLNSR